MKPTQILFCYLFSLIMINANPALADMTTAGSALPDNILQESWQTYKDRFIQTDGRVIDHSNQEISTSEGQAYAMLRAVWLNDPQTFSLVWNWAKDNLGYTKNGRFAWKWGQKCDKSWGILEDQSASDADTDIAFALIMAGKLWDKPELTDTARSVLATIWQEEVLLVNGKPYLLPGPWAKDLPKIRLNPSYFSPYEFRIFAKIDRSHNWLGLVNTSYDVLEQCTKLSRLSLPPDWCDLDKKSAQVSLDPTSPSSDYSYDAMRIPWRISVDYLWNNEPRAKKYLSELSFLKDSWDTSRTIRAAYTAQGVMRSFDEPLAGYACALPLFQITAPHLVKQVVREKLLSKYEDGIWSPQNDYYAQNWCWFGIALVRNAIIAPSI